MKVELPRDVIFLNKKKVCQYVGYSPAHIQRMEHAGIFPRRVKLGKSRVAWLATDIENWMNTKIAESQRGEK